MGTWSLRALGESISYHIMVQYTSGLGSMPQDRKTADNLRYAAQRLKCPLINACTSRHVRAPTLIIL